MYKMKDTDASRYPNQSQQMRPMKSNIWTRPVETLTHKAQEYLDIIAWPWTPWFKTSHNGYKLTNKTTILGPSLELGLNEINSEIGSDRQSCTHVEKVEYSLQIEPSIQKPCQPKRSKYHQV
jgi:hypothetical protein